MSVTKSDLPRVAGLLTDLAEALKDDSTWDRLRDWETVPRISSGEERGGGDGGTSTDDSVQDRILNAACARWFAEYRDLLGNLEAPIRRLLKLTDLASVENRKITRTRTGDLDPVLAAEAAAAGFCSSCWRYEQTCHDREKNGDGVYYDRNHCRRCARFLNEHGLLPPVELLRIWHGLGRRTWTTVEVETAVAKARERMKTKKAS